MSKHWFNNGVVQVFREVAPDETFVRGMLNSSKEKMREHKFSEEHRRHLSESKIGKPLSEDCRKKLVGRTPHNKGGTSWCAGLTKETDERIYNRSKKIQESSIGKPGTNTGKKFSEEHRNKIGDALRGRTPKKLSEEQLLMKATKQYLTRKKNNTFNTSKPEQDLYQQLLQEYDSKTIYRNYKDDIRYPFYCDFYIVEDDLFIELNAHWTHGGKPFDPNDSECQKQLAIWQEKAKTSKFYANAIETWTIRDVKKLKVANQNNLNYKVIY